LLDHEQLAAQLVATAEEKRKILCLAADQIRAQEEDHRIADHS